LGVDDGDATGRGAVAVAAGRCGATFGAAVAGLAGAFLAAAAARFDLGFSALVFVARRTVVFAAGLLAFVVRLTSCFAAAALPVFLLALPACLIGRFATAALPGFFLALANRLIGRLAVGLGTALVLTAALRAADFRFAVFTGRLAFVARPDDFDALLFFETLVAIELSPCCLRRSPALLNYALYRECSSLSQSRRWVFSAGGLCLVRLAVTARSRRTSRAGSRHPRSWQV
jgi:hypothetical protein